jgi:HEPN domain-containing protein
LSEIKYQLNPYGIWYYGESFNRLVEKLETALKALLYVAPNIIHELEALSKLMSVESFEDVGKEIMEWRNRVVHGYLDVNSCRKLYEASVRWRNTFIERIKGFYLVKLKLRMLSFEKVAKDMIDLPEDDKVKKWLQEEDGRITEFREACQALLFGLSTAAGFYFVRLCERALRDLYQKETGRDVEKKTWGTILDELEGYYKGKEKPGVLKLISYLKKLRDQIAHPERLLTQQEAEELYTFTLRVIREVKELEEAK